MPTWDQQQRPWFICRRCGKRGWIDSNTTSKCRECGGDGERLPQGVVVELRQFICPCDGHIWYARAEKSICKSCKKWVDAVPVGQEKGVFVCKFLCNCKECGCKNEYRVRCRMCDTAKCYSCRGRGHDEYHVKPYGFLARQHIRKTTDNEHSCSRCNGSGDCPNFKE